MTADQKRFLETLEYFNNNYNLITLGDDYAKDDKFDQQLTDEQKEPFYPKYVRLNIVKIKHDMQNPDKNYFEEFYNLEKEYLYYFFEILTQIEQALIILEDGIFAYKLEKKNKDRHNALQNKIDAIIEHAEIVGFKLSKTTLDELNGMKTSLTNYHFSKRQLFESLLYAICIILNSEENNARISNITNKIIELYFGIPKDDVSFTKDTNINYFNMRSYSYGYCKFKLMHN